MSGRLQVVYELACGSGEEAAARAREVAFEQTVELPPDLVAARPAERAAGRVEELCGTTEGGWEATISYPLELGGDLSQLLNLLFGNVSLQGGVWVRAVEWPPALLERFAGPRVGIAGLRRLCGVERARPLSCAALKPVGLGTDELAQLAGAFAAGGIDIVKDDHSLGDQPWAPFRERVEACIEAVGRRREDGSVCLYFPNLAGPEDELVGRLDELRRAGCRGALVSPLILGLERVRRLAADSDLALLAHPALAGAFFAPGHGIAPAVLLGDLFRLAGCDGVIYPNVGGRFRFSQEDCDALNRRLRGPLGALPPAVPVPAGGIDRRRVPEWVERYGPDTLFLLGASLYRGGDPEAAAAALAAALRG